MNLFLPCTVPLVRWGVLPALVVWSFRASFLFLFLSFLPAFPSFFSLPSYLIGTPSGASGFASLLIPHTLNGFRLCFRLNRHTFRLFAFINGTLSRSHLLQSAHLFFLVGTLFVNLKALSIAFPHTFC